jgi:hypothetical protein
MKKMSRKVTATKAARAAVLMPTGIQKAIIIVFVPHAPAAATRKSPRAAPLPHRLVHLRVPGSNERHTHAMLLYVLSGGLSQKICTPAFAC